MLDLVYIVLWSVALLADLVDGSPYLDIHRGGSLQFALRISRLRAVDSKILGLLPGIGEWGVLDHLLDSSLFLFELIPIEPDSIAPLADFGPAANVLGGNPQLPPAGLPNLDGLFDLAEYLVDQRHRHGSLVIGGTLHTFGSLAVGGCNLHTFGGSALLPFGFLQEFL